MTVLLVTDEGMAQHENWPDHPESPSRLAAAVGGIRAAGLGDALLEARSTPAPPPALAAVHHPRYVEALESLCSRGGGQLDGDTAVVLASWHAAQLAAGAGLEAVARLRAGGADGAFCAVRPPGHHATREGAMGFCLLNNIAVTASALAGVGERVLIIDWDVHHGNGTQEAFWSDPRVAFVSLHRYGNGFYPGTGGGDEIGVGEGRGLTANVPFHRGARGDDFKDAFTAVVTPLARRFDPAWVLVSAGFDAHVADPIGGLGLTASDFGDLTELASDLVPPGRIVLFLEGGYDLQALADSSAACATVLAGRRGGTSER